MHGGSSTYELNRCDTQELQFGEQRYIINLFNELLSLNKHEALETFLLTNVKGCTASMCKLKLFWKHFRNFRNFVQSVIS